jgi:hypothetical protein
MPIYRDAQGWVQEMEGLGAARSGLAWANAGIQLDLADFESTVRRITRV